MSEMYDASPSLTADYYLIGLNHYVSKAGSQGLFLHILENYSGENPNQIGSFTTNLRAPYDERDKILNILPLPSVRTPARVTLRGHMVVFQGQNSLEVDEIVKVIPFKSPGVVPPSPSKP